MKNAVAKALLPSMMLGAMAMGGYGYPFDNSRSPKLKYHPSEPRPKGYEPKGKTEDELAKRKEHRKVLKARKNARKGVYANKIKYPKKRRS